MERILEVKGMPFDDDSPEIEKIALHATTTTRVMAVGLFSIAIAALSTLDYPSSSRASYISAFIGGPMLVLDGSGVSVHSP